MELTYTTPEALRDKQFTASRDPSFSDVRDYLTLPSSPVLGITDVRYFKHLETIIIVMFLVCSC